MTFEINVNSWHYKLIRGFDTERMPRSFCAYWSKLLFVLAVYVFMVGLVACFLALAAYCLYTDPLVTIGITAAIAFIIGFAVILGNWIADREEKKWQRILSGEPEKMSLVGMKIKAWKDKVCPAIEYKYK